MFKILKEKNYNVYIGIQYNSIPETEIIIEELKEHLVVKYERVTRQMLIDSDASSFLFSLLAYKKDNFPEYNFCYFIHTKGITSDQNESRNFMMNELFNIQNEKIFDMQNVGSYGPVMSIFLYDIIPEYQYKKIECMRKFSTVEMPCEPLPYFYTYTFFMIRGHILKKYMMHSKDELFTTYIGNYSDRWMFERDFFHFVDMMGYIPTYKHFHRLGYFYDKKYFDPNQTDETLYHQMIGDWYLRNKGIK